MYFATTLKKIIVTRKIKEASITAND